MVQKLMMGVILTLVLLLTIFAIGPLLGEVAFDQRADATSESLSCTTASGATSCNVTLSSVHQNFDTTGMTVTETSPGSTVRTPSASLDADDRVTLTVSGLSGSTTYTFTVDYFQRGTNVDAVESTVLNWAPLLFIGGLVIIAALYGARRMGVLGGTG